MTASLEPITAERCVVRDTASRQGRHLSVVPGQNAARHLHYGRIILAAGAAPLSFATENRETGLLCLKGAATIETLGATHSLVPYDGLYVPRDANIVVRPGPAGCDLAEIAAPVEKRYPLQLVRFADVQKDPPLHSTAGGEASRRNLNIVFGKDVDAGRIMAGVTFSSPGNWTSWPPSK